MATFLGLLSGMFLEWDAVARQIIVFKTLLDMSDMDEMKGNIDGRN